MLCKKCSQQMPSTARFCPKCGKEVLENVDQITKPVSEPPIQESVHKIPVKTESDIQTDIGKLAAELQKDRATLKNSRSTIAIQIIVLIGSIAWLIVSLIYNVSVFYKILSAVILVSDAWILIKTMTEYMILRSDANELEGVIAKKRKETLSKN